MVGTPGLVADVPLNRERIVIVADAREVTLLPLAAVNEGDLVERKGRDVVRFQIGNDGVWMLARVTHDVGHRCDLPAAVDRRVAALACR